MLHLAPLKMGQHKVRTYPHQHVTGNTEHIHIKVKVNIISYIKLPLRVISEFI
jgi:hypothetical protein